MAADSPSARFLRLVLEAGAIFLGVTLGFLADDYRDYLNDRSLETESLQQILVDLELDHDDMSPMLVQTQALAESTRWISNRAASGGLPPDSLDAVLDSIQSTSVFWYEPVATAYSGLKSTGRIDLIRDAELKNAIVHYFEDRQPLIVTLNKVWQEVNRLWWDQAAPHIEVLPTDISQAYANIGAVDARSFASDRRLLFYAAELSGRSLDFQAYVAEAIALNEGLAAEVESHLAAR